MKRIKALSFCLLLLSPALSPLTAAHAAVNANGVGITTSGLIAYWNAAHPDSYMSGSGTWGDLANNGSSLTRNNSVPYYRDSAGSYFGFSGGGGNVSTNSYFSNSSLNYDFTNGFSFIFYGSFGSVSDNFERIFDFGNGAQASNFLAGRYGTNAQLFYESWNGGLSKGNCLGPTTGTGSITTGVAFYALTVTASGGCQWYYNGSTISTTQNFFNSYTNINPVNVARTNNWVGRSNWSGDGYFEGRMYSLALYNTTLNSSQIWQSYLSLSDTSWPSGSQSSSSVNEAQTSGGTIYSSESGSYFVLVGGLDQTKFTINSSSGSLTFVTTPNYESPDDSGGNRVYDVTVRILDPNGNYYDYSTTVTILDITENTTLTLPSLSASPTKGTPVTITVTPAGDGTSVPGKITYLVAGKRIPGCYKKAYSGTGNSTCSWKPPSMGYEEITVTFTPTNTSFLASTAKKSFWILKRSNNR